MFLLTFVYWVVFAIVLAILVVIMVAGCLAGLLKIIQTVDTNDRIRERARLYNEAKAFKKLHEEGYANWDDFSFDKQENLKRKYKNAKKIIWCYENEDKEEEEMMEMEETKKEQEEKKLIDAVIIHLSDYPSVFEEKNRAMINARARQILRYNRGQVEMEGAPINSRAAATAAAKRETEVKVVDATNNNNKSSENFEKVAEKKTRKRKAKETKKDV